MPDWTNGIKRLAVQAYENSQPCDACFGTVTGTAPLAVELEQLKLPLGEAQLVLSDNLADRIVTVMVDGKTGTALISNALKPGDRVVLLRKSGGQKYVILSRIDKGGSG